MNPVLDIVLGTLYPLIPYDVAQVLLLEAPGRLFLAREVSPELRKYHGPERAKTLDSGAFPVLTRALQQRRGVLISDTLLASDWGNLPAGITARSWLGVPLQIGEEAIGILSLAHTRPAGFTPEHLRLAASLAVPVSLAIQNARLHERGEIFRSELEQRLSKAQRTDS
jgi:GAF domain-containing protein